MESSSHRRIAVLVGWLARGTLMLCLDLVFGAQTSANWRIFRASEGLKESASSAISLSPRTNVWIKHSEASEISMFDGYRMSQYPSPGRNNFRVYESRSGQLWSLYADGLSVFDRKVQQWVQHPIREIQAEIQADPLRQIRQITLLPAEIDHVYFLLSDRLMEYDVGRSRATMIRHSSESKLGRFFEMAEARDGGIWVTGARGLAHIPGPARHLTATTEWQEFLAGESLPVENLQRPFEDERGGITTLAATPFVPGKRVIVHFDGTVWSERSVTTTNEILRHAWTGWDGTTWGCTINSLLRFDPSQAGRFTREGTWMGQYKDVLVETNGVFWLATSEGLVRYAPFLWRVPDEVEEFASLVHAIIEDASGRLWFACTEGLLRHEDGRWMIERWPEGYEVNFTSTDHLFALMDGRIAIAGGENPLLFDPTAKKFQSVVHPEGRRLRLGGQLKNGALIFQTGVASADEAGDDRLEMFNGTEFLGWPETPVAWPFTRELHAVLTSQNGDIWLAGAGGLMLVREGGTQTFGPAQGFKDDRALCLLEIGDGKIWCGGSGRIYEFTGKRWSVKMSGLDRVSGMARTRDGKIWIATARDLHVHDKGSWLTHGPEEGLPTATIAQVFEDSKGRLWAGTTHGLSCFHPDADISPPLTLPPVVMLPEAPSTEDSVNIQLSAVDKWHHTPAGRLLFACRLDGGDWSAYTNSMVKVLERLGSGQHRLEVRAMDRNWNEDASLQAFEFTVMLPWHREPRLIAVTVSGIVLVLFFAALAVNRHWQLIRSYAKVEKIVAIRTRELEKANAELLHSQKMKALGAMAAGIAHDFNNILSIIKGSAQIIERNLADEEKIRTRVSRIKTVVEQGSGIVKSMLGLSRVTPRDFLECDLPTLAQETIKLLADRIHPDVTIRVAAAPDLPPVRTVKELIQQMLYNLVLNAVDATEGAGEVILRTGRITSLPANVALAPAPAPGYVVLAIEDSGTGIAPEVLPRIFEPFFTTKALSSRRGTGLGLSMVYELAKEMGYGLHVRSAFGQGTVFMIIIPDEADGTVRPAART